jgi:hypothetical protein
VEVGMDYASVKPKLYPPVASDSPLYRMRNRMYIYLKRNRRRSWGQPMTEKEKRIYFEFA